MNWLNSSETKSILKLGIPIMLGQLGVILVGFVDNIMVGHYGTQELAASSFVNGWINLAFVISAGFSYGLTPLVAGSYATGNGFLRSLLKSGLLANFIVGLLLTLLMGLCLLNIRWFSQPEELLPLIIPYYFIQLISLIPISLFNGYKQFVDAVGETKMGMLAVISSNIFNVLFNYLLIFGKFGFPELGLVGAGLATLGARVLSLVVLVWAVHRSELFENIFKENSSLKGRVERKSLQRLFQLGIPSGIQMGLEAGAFSVAVIMVGWLGSAELAAHQVVNTMGTLGFMMFYGMSAAVCIMVGRYYELGKPTMISAVVKSGVKIQLIMVAVVIALVIFFRHQVGLLFGADEEINAIVAVLVFPLATYQISDMLQILFTSTLRGMQDVRFTAVAAFVCYTFITIGTAYLLGFVLDLGIIGVWSGFPVGFTTLALLLIFRYKYLLNRCYKRMSTASV